MNFAARIDRRLEVRLRRLYRYSCKVAALATGDFSCISGSSVEESVAGRIRAEQLAGILRHTVSMMLANSFNAVVLVLACWGRAEPGLLEGWAVMQLVFSGNLLIRRLLARRSMPPASVSRTSVHRAIRNALVLGMLWGAAPFFFYGAVSEEARIVITCLCAGMIGGGAFALASIPSAVLVFILPIAVGSIRAVIATGNADYWLIVLLVCCYCTVLVYGAFVRALQAMERLISQIDIERFARLDSLTKLDNRASFRATLREASVRLQGAGECCALFYIDLDRFRDVNERYGHAAGDDLLVAIARRLQTAVRPSDTLARLGGDEFAIVAPALQNEAEIRAYARRILIVLEKPCAAGAVDLKVSASIGVAVAHPGAADIDIALHNADMALYYVKHNGRGDYHLFQPEDDAGCLARDALERDLRKALGDGGLRLEFQPFLDLAGNCVSGFEALLRWDHPIRGTLQPQQFVAIAEECGLIEPIGVWVLRQACATASAWPANLRVAVNVSAYQLRSRALLAHIVSALDQAGIEPHRLEIEITETVLIDDHPMALEVLACLRRSGVHLSLDDFGVGYSSLNYLRRLPFDRVKIDRSFVSEVPKKRDASAIVRSIISLARELGIEVTAEGVETLDQLAFLRDCGCAEAQGFLIGTSIAMEEIGAFLATSSERAEAVA
jgi:diguanylate cyclase (GGDEF)-like protein